MTHIISFRRPELRYVLSKMSVPPEADVAAQVHHLQELGYQIVDVTPPLEDHGPDDKIVEVSPPLDGYGHGLRPRTPDLSVVHDADPAPRSKPLR